MFRRQRPPRSQPYQPWTNARPYPEDYEHDRDAATVDPRPPEQRSVPPAQAPDYRRWNPIDEASAQPASFTAANGGTVPFKSPAQERFMYAKHPEIANKWEKEYGNAPGYADGGEAAPKEDGPIGAILLHMKEHPEDGTPGKPSEDMPGEDGGPVDPDLKVAAEDLLSAVKSGDSDAVARALKAAFTLCEEYEGDEDHEDEGGPPPPSSKPPFGKDEE